jgi:hypothetical protein
MLRKLFAVLGPGVATASGGVATPPYSPYSNEAINSIYNLLFCDNISSFRPKSDEKLASWQAVLFSEPADTAALESLAADLSQEGRIRSLVSWRLRSVGKKVPSKVPLGVIVEIPLSGGLDALAASPKSPATTLCGLLPTTTYKCSKERNGSPKRRFPRSPRDCNFLNDEYRSLPT